MPAHIKASLLGPSLTLPVSDGAAGARHLAGRLPVRAPRPRRAALAARHAARSDVPEPLESPPGETRQLRSPSARVTGHHAECRATRLRGGVGGVDVGDDRARVSAARRAPPPWRAPARGAAPRSPTRLGRVAERRLHVADRVRRRGRSSCAIRPAGRGAPVLHRLPEQRRRSAALSASGSSALSTRRRASPRTPARPPARPRSRTPGPTISPCFCHASCSDQSPAC